MPDIVLTIALGNQDLQLVDTVYMQDSVQPVLSKATFGVSADYGYNEMLDTTLKSACWSDLSIGSLPLVTSVPRNSCLGDP